VATAIGTAIALDNDPQAPRSGTAQAKVGGGGTGTLTGGPVTYRTVSTNSEPFSTMTTDFGGVPLAEARVPIDPGQTTLISARFTAESRCHETDGAGELNHCEVRILIGGVEGMPQNSAHPPHTLAFDSTNTGGETRGSWESHSTESHRCVHNPDAKPMVVLVAVQWKVTNLGGDADRPIFGLDDWSLVAERADGCSES
jgi:hypothetical protein